MKPFTTTILIIIALIVGVITYYFWLPVAIIAGSFILYLLTSAQLEYLERAGLSARYAAMVLSTTWIIALLAACLYIAIPLIDQARNFSTQIPTLLDSISTYQHTLQSSIPFADSLIATAKERALSTAALFVELSSALATALVTIPIITIILLGSRKTLYHELANQIPNDYFEVTMTILNRITAHLQDYITARSVQTIVLFFLYAITFTFIGLPQPLIIGLVCSLLNLIPYLGPIIMCIPVGLIALVSGGTPLLAWAIGIVIFAQIIDNIFIQTTLVSHFVDVHPLAVVITTLIGGEVAGAIGMIIAIPLYVMTKIIVLGIYEYTRAVNRHEEITRLEQEQQLFIS